MTKKYLGAPFDIHGGGSTSSSPITRMNSSSRAAPGREFARIWMHNGMLRLTGEKMSKSLGNIATLEEVVDEWGGRRCSSSS